MTPYRYAAFISYCHKDKSWARWLHKKLESYVVPSPLRGRETPLGTIGRRLGTVFLDEAELGSSSDLDAAIRSSLADSATLVVICSRAAADSARVAEEIRAFETCRSRDRILCFIVDGRPAAGKRGIASEFECFPAPLLEGPEPLAADARGGRAARVHARDRIIAGILDLGFDELRQRELVRRNRRLFTASFVSAAAAISAIALMAFAIAARNEAETQRKIAEVESRKAQRVLEFVLDSFQSADPYHSNGLEITAAEILERSRERIDSEFLGEPDIRRTMRESMALVYHRLGEYQPSETLIRSNLSELDQVADAEEFHRQTGYLASTLIESGQFEEAEQLLRDQLNYYQTQDGMEVAIAGALNDLGRVLKDMGRLEDSEHFLRAAVGEYERLGTDQNGLMIAYNNLGVLLQQSSRLDEAREFFDKTIAIREQVYGSAHPYTARAENNLGTLLYSKGDISGARVYYERALDKRRAAFGDDHAEVAESTYNVGLIYMELGEFEDALEFVNRALDLDRAALGHGHPAVAYDYFALARINAARGDWTAAGEYLERAAAIRDAKLQPDHQLSKGTRLFESAYHFRMGHRAQAARIASELQAVFARADQDEHPTSRLAAGIQMLSETDASDHAGIDKARLRRIIDTIQSSDQRIEQSILAILLETCSLIEC